MKPKLRPSPEWLKEQYEIQHRDSVQMAKELGVNPKTAWEWIRQAGIETRRRGFGHPQNHFIKGQQVRLGIPHSASAKEKVGLASRARSAVPYMRNGQHWLKGKSGDINPHWKGGITPDRQAFYRSPEWKRCVQTVWKRDNATCRRCGLNYRDVNRQTRHFALHHFDSFAIVKRRADPDNIVLLCNTCHYWVHSKANDAKLYLGAGHFAEQKISSPTLFDTLEQQA